LPILRRLPSFSTPR
jgi:hypothetical protein